VQQKQVEEKRFSKRFGVSKNGEKIGVGKRGVGHAGERGERQKGHQHRRIIRRQDTQCPPFGEGSQLNPNLCRFATPHQRIIQTKPRQHEEQTHAHPPDFRCFDEQLKRDVRQSRLNRKRPQRMTQQNPQTRETAKRINVVQTMLA